MIDDIDFKIAKLELKPGDTLVVKIGRRLTPEMAERVHDYVKRNLRDDIKVMIIEDDVALLVLSPTPDMPRPT